MTESAPPPGPGPNPLGPGASALAALADIRGEGEAADGRVQVVVDGTSNLVGLTLDPDALGLGADELAAAIAAAFAQARTAAQTQARTAAAALPAPAIDAAALSRLGELGAQSLERIQQLMATAQRLGAHPPR